MIETYLSTSRRVKPAPTPALLAHYEDMYDAIVENTRPRADAPKLFVTYSSERRCEFIRIAGRNFLVYDQYLGQTFDRLNRIQFFKDAAHRHSHTFACKVLAEHLIRLGAPLAATFCALAAWRLEEDMKKSGVDTFRLSKKDETTRINLVAVQELFVMAHELAHFFYSIDESELRAETSKYVEQFLEAKRTLQANPEKKAMGADLYDCESLTTSNCIAEMFADDFGALMAFRIATEGLGIPCWQSIAGITLAFKHLRLLHHVEIMAHGVAELEKIRNAEAFRDRIAKMADEVWSAAHGIRVLQLREHFLRYRLEAAAVGAEPDSGAGFRLAADYDKNTEIPVTVGLARWLHDSLSPARLLKMADQPAARHDPTGAVDFLTGWSKVPPRTR